MSGRFRFLKGFIASCKNSVYDGVEPMQGSFDSVIAFASRSNHCAQDDILKMCFGTQMAELYSTREFSSMIIPAKLEPQTLASEKWYAIQTRYRSERKASALLKSQGVETFPFSARFPSRLPDMKWN
jgi:hypothetical protein